jgi:hypothetical protein
LDGLILQSMCSLWGHESDKTDLLDACCELVCIFVIILLEI